MNLANESIFFLSFAKKMIARLLKPEIQRRIFEDKKIIILYGPRQVGKTTLIKNLLQEFNFKTLSINADEQRYTEVLSSRDLNKLKLLVEGYDLLFIDEAQRVPDIGINLKILHDSLPDLKIIATGSSSFELANKIREPLTGRTWTFQLFPISVGELNQSMNFFELDDRLEEFLLYGAYPDVFSFSNQEDKIRYLQELSSAYLYKDILEITSIKYSGKLQDLLRLLAYQIGAQVSMNELGNALGMSKDTVEHYIDLLEKAFVVFRLKGFSRNLRKEITKMDKIYFYDLGIRNILINNFNSLHLRNDTGALWENFLTLERRKKLAYEFNYANTYFWRTYTGAELDYIEEANGQLMGYEFKFSSKKGKIPSSWVENYPNASFENINRENYLSFII